LRIALNFDKVTTLRITILINGVEEIVDVILDTGYTSHAGHGLSLPPNGFGKYAEQTQETRPVKTGHLEDLHPFIPDVRIIKIRDYRLRESVLVPSVIMGEIPLLGVLFLQNCTLHLDGRRKSGYLELDPRW
jgi:predicted aspartyl protease